MIAVKSSSAHYKTPFTGLKRRVMDAEVCWNLRGQDRENEIDIDEAEETALEVGNGTTGIVVESDTTTTLGKGREVPGKENTERGEKAVVADITTRGIGTGKGTIGNETGKGPAPKVIEVGRENVNGSPRNDLKYIVPHDTKIIAR